MKLSKIKKAIKIIETLQPSVCPNDLSQTEFDFLMKFLQDVKEDYECGDCEWKGVKYKGNVWNSCDKCRVKAQTYKKKTTIMKIGNKREGMSLGIMDYLS